MKLNSVPAIIKKNINIFICPKCQADLELGSSGDNISCSGCGQIYKFNGEIPLLFWPNEWDTKTDVTEIVKSFYEKNPFPNYEDTDSTISLREKAEKGIFARLLDEQIPFGSKVLEVGCGTGQLSNFLGMTWGRNVFASDICINSLKLGQQFKKKNNLEDVGFIQMNLFRPSIKTKSFDIVICNGVLHHTSDPFLGFQTISRLVKKGGFIVVGLYNLIGRIPTDIRRVFFNLSKDHFATLDPRLGAKNVSNKRKHIWFMDQYKHPHESKHTIEEVLKWFDKCDLAFVNAIPKLSAFVPFSSSELLFKSNPRGSSLDHFFVQLSLLLEGAREGGFFLMIGKKQH